MKKSDRFTVSFFPPENKKALGILGTRSGRDGDKVAESGLTPIDVDGCVGYKEANMTFLCRKIYQHQMTKEDLAADIQEYYQENEKPYPRDEKGEWHPHWVFLGEVIKVVDKQ